MKTRLLGGSSLLLLALTVIGGAYAHTPKQPAQRQVVQLRYMKSEPGRAAEYVKLAREFQLPVHQELVNQGRLVAWKVYEVRWPNGESLAYDFVSMMVHPTLADLERPLYGPVSGGLYDKIHGAAKVAELAPKNAAARKLLNSDYCFLAASTADWAKTSHPIVEAIYMKNFPGKGGEMLRLQREYHLPVHEERIKAGTATGWATTQLRFAPDDFPYDSVSFNAYASLAQIETQSSQAFRDKWAAKGAEVRATLPTLRKRVKAELWRVVTETTPAAQVQKTTE